ncbi:hypothetical protein TRICI_002078, partial [Trichomonascus ciferrii]
MKYTHPILLGIIASIGANGAPANDVSSNGKTNATMEVERRPYNVTAQNATMGVTKDPNDPNQNLFFGCGGGDDSCEEDSGDSGCGFSISDLIPGLGDCCGCGGGDSGCDSCGDGGDSCGSCGSSSCDGGCDSGGSDNCGGCGSSSCDGGCGGGSSRSCGGCGSDSCDGGCGGSSNSDDSCGDSGDYEDDGCDTYEPPQCQPQPQPQPQPYPQPQPQYPPPPPPPPPP